MKKGLLFSCLVACLCLFALNAEAQIKTPAPSPIMKMETSIGLTDVTVAYSRPSKKERSIFAVNGLVPFGETWRTGANASTKISFSTDVKINGSELKKGEYALYTIPRKTEWDLIFYNNTTHWGVPREWKEDEVALRVKAKPEMFPAGVNVETFTIHVGNNKMNSATMELLWDNVMVPFTVETDVDSRVMKSIETAMKGTSRGDYYVAARYYYDNDKDLDKAHNWIQKANKLDAKFWQLRLQSLIEAKMGKKKEAIMSANQSIKLAKEAGNMDYVRMNEKSIKEWGGKVMGAMPAGKSK